MKTPSEIDVMKLFDENLSKIQDSGTRNRILRWAWGKFSTESIPEKTKKIKKKPKKKKGGKHKTKAKRPSIVKDLNLRPKGKKSFKDFFAEKTPRVGGQTYVVCVYYLEKLLGLKNISIDHVYTCMKEVKRKPPNNLSNAMTIVSSRKGWIDTSNLLDITITVPGENLVEHDLQPKKRN